MTIQEAMRVQFQLGGWFYYLPDVASVNYNKYKVDDGGAIITDRNRRQHTWDRIELSAAEILGDWSVELDDGTIIHDVSEYIKRLCAKEALDADFGISR